MVNIHQRMFRAKAATVKLIISDWKSNGAPGGPIGQELAFNCIEVEPFIEE